MKFEYFLIIFSILLILIGFMIIPEQVEEEIVVEEDKGSGILIVESVPPESDVFLNGEPKGKTPLTLYGIEVDNYNLIIKKEGYNDYQGAVDVEAGKKAEVSAFLEEIDMEVIEVIEEVEPEEEPIVETEDIMNSGTILIGNKVLKFYDFTESSFTDAFEVKTDVFSKKYDDYLLFTRYSPVKMKVVEKGFNEVTKADCTYVKGSIASLYSGQTLCISTKEGKIAAVGGNWIETTGASLNWKIFD